MFCEQTKIKLFLIGDTLLINKTFYLRRIQDVNAHIYNVTCLQNYVKSVIKVYYVINSIMLKNLR